MYYDPQIAQPQRRNMIKGQQEALCSFIFDIMINDLWRSFAAEAPGTPAIGISQYLMSSL